MGNEGLNKGLSEPLTKPAAIANNLGECLDAIISLEQFVNKVDGNEESNRDELSPLKGESLRTILNSLPETINSMQIRVLEAIKKLNEMLYDDEIKKDKETEGLVRDKISKHLVIMQALSYLNDAVCELETFVAKTTNRDAIKTPSVNDEKKEIEISLQGMMDTLPASFIDMKQRILKSIEELNQVLYG